jgi:hypothetical protein
MASQDTKLQAQGVALVTVSIGAGMAMICCQNQQSMSPLRLLARTAAEEAVRLLLAEIPAIWQAGPRIGLDSDWPGFCVCHLLAMGERVLRIVMGAF